jgi:hypothetical protein
MNNYYRVHLQFDDNPTHVERIIHIPDGNQLELIDTVCSRITFLCGKKTFHLTHLEYLGSTECDT